MATGSNVATRSSLSGMDRWRERVDRVRDQSDGQWLNIFSYFCPGMFDDAIANLGQHVTCPFHGGDNDFRFLKVGRKGPNTDKCGIAMCTCGPMKGAYPDGFAVLQKAMGLQFAELVRKLEAYHNGDEIERPISLAKPVIVPKEKPRSDEEILAKAAALWEARKVMDPATTPYYVERGIAPAVIAKMQDVGVLNSLGYWFMPKKEKGEKDDGRLEKLGSFPAILAAMRKADGKLCAVHRTWLSKDRTDKAPVPKAKKLSETPDCVGGAIRLFDAEDAEVMGITEGIETAGSAYQLAWGRYWKEFGEMPVWACYSEGGIRSFEIPPELLRTLRKIVVFADNDENGIGYRAALAFKARMAKEHPDIEVVTKMPDVVGWDWNDVLVNL